MAIEDVLKQAEEKVRWCRRVTFDRSPCCNCQMLIELITEVRELRKFKDAFPPVDDGQIARRMVEDRVVAEMRAELRRLKKIENRARRVVESRVERGSEVNSFSLELLQRAVEHRSEDD